MFLFPSTYTECQVHAETEIYGAIGALLLVVFRRCLSAGGKEARYSAYAGKNAMENQAPFNRLRGCRAQCQTYINSR